MKKLPYIIGIPAVAVVLVLGGAMLWQLKNKTVDMTVTSPRGPLPNAVGKAAGTKPVNPFSGLFGSPAKPTLIPTPTPASPSAMQAELDAIIDDGGAADFASLSADVSGL